jgi:hypothetical protein
MLTHLATNEQRIIWKVMRECCEENEENVARRKQ